MNHLDELITGTRCSPEQGRRRRGLPRPVRRYGSGGKLLVCGNGGERGGCRSHRGRAHERISHPRPVPRGAAGPARWPLIRRWGGPGGNLQGSLPAVNLTAGSPCSRHSAMT